MENQEKKSNSEDNTKKETPNPIPKTIYCSDYWNKNLKWTKQNL